MKANEDVIFSLYKAHLVCRKHIFNHQCTTHKQNYNWKQNSSTLRAYSYGKKLSQLARKHFDKFTSERCPGACSPGKLLKFEPLKWHLQHSEKKQFVKKFRFLKHEITDVFCYKSPVTSIGTYFRANIPNDYLHNYSRTNKSSNSTTFLASVATCKKFLYPVTTSITLILWN